MQQDPVSSSPEISSRILAALSSWASRKDERIYLFGSRARGTNRHDSDHDVLVVGRWATPPEASLNLPTVLWPDAEIQASMWEGAFCVRLTLPTGEELEILWVSSRWLQPPISPAARKVLSKGLRYVHHGHPDMGG